MSIRDYIVKSSEYVMKAFPVLIIYYCTNCPHSQCVNCDVIMNYQRTRMVASLTFASRMRTDRVAVEHIGERRGRIVPG